METTPVTISLPSWMPEAAKKSMEQRGLVFDEMVSLLIYEYLENYTVGAIPREAITGAQIPAVAQMSNSILVSALDMGASEVTLTPAPSHLALHMQVGEKLVERFRFPNHIKAELYERFKRMAEVSRQQEGDYPRVGSFVVTREGKKCKMTVTCYSASYDDKLTIILEEVV